MTIRFPLRWQSFHLCKQGSAAEDYEDASAADVASGRFAVADGASEASFAGLWAQLLVDGFIADPHKPWRNLDWVGPLRQQWAEKVDGLSLPWYAEEKRELGGFATFLGLALRFNAVGAHGYWKALAVGDCCLFHAHDQKVVKAFPMTQSTDFNNQPHLLGSRACKDSLPHALAQGKWQLGDRFLLMTDALAQWFLLQSEQRNNPLVEIRSLLKEQSPESAFVDWVAEKRRQSLLRNDDVTLIVVDVE